MIKYSLGIDLGTTFSAAATVDETGLASMVGLGNRAMEIPTVVHVAPDGGLSVGELAERQATTDPTGIAREFKRRVGDTTPIYAGGATFTPEGLTAHVLRWVVEQTVERVGERPAQVTLTHPATWTTFNVEKLVAAAELAGLTTVRTCPEPVAAAHHYAAHHSVAVGDRMCIYDLGGGTFDVCVLVKTDDGFEILGKPTGIPFLGGADFDQLIISAVVEGLSALNCDVEPDDPGIAALRRECVDAKEALSADVEAVIPVRLQGLSTTYRITRSEFEAMIDAAVELTIEATGHALRSAGVSAGDLAAIVLVGGSSRIPLVSQKLEHAFKCRIAVNTHPKHEVALGAALAGCDDADPEPAVVPITLRAPHRRRQVLLSISSAVAAVVLSGTIIGRSWLLPSVAAETTPPITASQSFAPSSGSSEAAPPESESATTPPSVTPSSPVESTPLPVPDQPAPVETTASVLSLAANAPVSFDELTVSWFHTLCDGGSRIQQAEPIDGMVYANISLAQNAYVESYSRRATIAATTADTLARMVSGQIADGRIDAAQAVGDLRSLSQALTSAGISMAQAQITTSTELGDANDAAALQVLQSYRPVGVEMLSAEEQAFVATLPGCERLDDR